MLEAVRISRAAYPHRLPRGAVARRFAPLAREAAPGNAELADCDLAVTEPRHMTTAQLRALMTRKKLPYGGSESQEELATKVEAAGASGLNSLLQVLLPNGG